MIRSPPKTSNAQLTPEWRRRLLGNNGASPEQGDLFSSPAGLERIFKNPKDQASPSKQPVSRGLSFLRGADALPSSPPLLSTYSDFDQSYIEQHNPPSELEPVQEADEDDGNYAPSQLIDSPLEKASRQDGASLDDTLQHHALSEASLPSRPPQAIVKERSILTPNLEQGDSNNSIVTAARDGERTISGQSELRHEGFSPVILSAQSTSHGNFDHPAPEDSHVTSDPQGGRNGSRIAQFLTNDQSNIADGTSRLGDSLPDDLETGTPEVAEIGDFVNLKRGGYSETGSFRRRPLSVSFNRDVSEISGRFSPISTKFSSPPSDILPPGFHQPARFRNASSNRTSSVSHCSRRSHSTGSLRSDVTEPPIIIPKRTRQSEHADAEGSDSSSAQMDIEEDKTVDGKRPRSSPDKDRKPKRQKTMHGADFSELSKSTLNAVQAKHNSMHFIIGKRKDARHESNASQADALIMSRRHILRPRNPTPSQRRGTRSQSEEHEPNVLDSSTTPAIHLVQEQLESLVVCASSPAPATGMPLPEPVATMTMNAAKRMQEAGRKRSYTTQDYLDEAMQIMTKLRAGRKPESGLGSVQESVSEPHSDEEPELAPDMTNLTISRPPSREGPTSGWRRPIKERVDTEVAIHLRQYRERDNTEFTIDSSLGSLRLNATEQPRRGQNHDVLEKRADVVSSETIAQTSGGNREWDFNDMHDGPRSFGSASTKTQSAPQSWDSSTGKTIATNSTRRSETVATLAPNAVAHLIPEQVAGMSFDQKRRVWVKDKSLPRSIKEHGDMSCAEESEQDPLGNIPDLSVDEVKELSRNASQKGGADDILKRFAEDLSSLDQPKSIIKLSQQYSDRASSTQETFIARSQTREGSEASGEPSSVSSKDPHLASSTAPAFETRETSCSTTRAIHGGKKRAGNIFPRPEAQKQEDDDAEHEIEVTHEQTHEVSHKRVSHVTISFSTPAAPRTSMLHDVHISSERSHRPTGSEHEDGANDFQSFQHHRAYGPFLPSSRQATPIAKQNKDRVGHGKLFPRIHEHEEWSLLPATDDPREISFQVNVSSPQAGGIVQIANDVLVSPSARHRADVTFLLSDLPDFSFHQVDERRPSERLLAERLAVHELTQADRPFSETTKNLVRELTNVEPEEPFWDELQQLDLHDRHLTSLHGLSEFCPNVQNLDVSTNGLRDLDGAPASIRYLKAQANSLSSLTGFTFLMNLQYLDISDNEIDNVEGLSCLVHLRELRADNNEISGLGELKNLDGLQKLHLRRNKFETLDLEHNRLNHLVELDLTGNRIMRISGLDQVSQLDVLVLDDNKLQTESFEFEESSACLSLSVLKIRHNMLQQLPVSLFPGLKVLLADGNQLPTNADVSQLAHLQVLSLRRQQSGKSRRAEHEVVRMPGSDLHQLALSANRIPTFVFPHFMYDLQRLELASCGIRSIPSNIGTLAPNLRFLNLDSNAIKDIRPLANLDRLRKIHLAGNRLSRLRKTIIVLSKLKSLAMIDMRDNPCTVGFYPQATSMAKELVLRSASDSHNEETDTLPRQSSKEDSDFRNRLDEETHLRRRVYELLLAGSCKHITVVDGLDFDRHEFLVKDPAWDLLNSGGIVRKPELLP